MGLAVAIGPTTTFFENSHSWMPKEPQVERLLAVLKGLGDSALAVAAKPSLGQAGFRLIAVAALLLTASAGPRGRRQRVSLGGTPT